MLFNSLSFILFFLPFALAGYYGLALLGPKWAAAWLVAVSFLFYSWWAAALVVLLAASIAFNFTCGLLILRAREKEALKTVLLTVGICGNLSLLIYYKYFFPLLNWLGFHGIIALPHPYSILLPLGISFFTFTQIGYLVDCRGGVVKTSRLLNYSLFVTFFPHLIAGPILHHREILPQFADPETYRFRFRNLAVGVTLFVIGLAKKVVIADQLFAVVNRVFSDTRHLTSFDAWNGVLSYSAQLYFDFSGYSDMAIGLALMFGVRFPANFNSPYKAASIIDFWQRWHMTLTRYLTLYLYTPIALSVSRHRLARGQSVSRQAISTPGGFVSLIAYPTLFTMTLVGIWHGAGPTFLIFGVLHGIYLTINHAYRSFGPRVPKTPPHPVWRTTADVGKIALTFFAVVIAQVFFRATSVHDALRLLKGMSIVGGFSDHVSVTLTYGDQMNAFHPALHLALLAAAFFLIWAMPNSLQILGDYEPSLSQIRLGSLISFLWKPNFAWGVIVGLVAALALLEVTGTTEFLYFRF